MIFSKILFSAHTHIKKVPVLALFCLFAMINSNHLQQSSQLIISYNSQIK